MTAVISEKTELSGAIVGIGGYGTVHLENLFQLVDEGRIRMCAAVHTGAPHESKMADKLRSMGCRLFLSPDEMFNKMEGELDFCTLPTSIPSHVPLAVQCIERGIHCLVEKPLTGDLKHLELLERTMAANPSIVVVAGFQSMFQPEIREARERLGQGQIGRLKSVRVIGAWPRSHDYYGRNAWAGCVESCEGKVYDSPMNNAMAHYLNLALYWGSSMTGKPAAVQSVEGYLYRAQAIGNFDTGICRFQLDCGVPVGAWMTHSSREMIAIQIIVDGEDGRLVWDCDARLQWEQKGSVIPSHLTSAEDSRDIMFNEFLDSIQGHDRPLCRNIPHAAGHVKAVQLLQSEIPVRDVNSSLIRQEEREGQQFTYIEGVEACLREGYENNTLRALGTP